MVIIAEKYKEYMFKTVFMALVIAGCAGQPTQDSIPADSPIIVIQDTNSCMKDIDTPWCKSACLQAAYSWCTK